MSYRLATDEYEPRHSIDTRETIDIVHSRVACVWYATVATNDYDHGYIMGFWSNIGSWHQVIPGRD